MFWKIPHQGRNSSILKLVVSISWRQISAWHGAAARVCLCLKTATNLSSLILWVSFPCIWTVNYLSLPPCSRVHLCNVFFAHFSSATSDPASHRSLVCQVSAGETVLEQQPSQGLCLQGLWWLHSALLPPRCTNHHTGQSPPLCDLSDTLLPGKGDTWVPWLVSQLKNKALHELFYFLPLYSPLLRSLLEYCVQLPTQERCGLLEWVQRMGTKMERGLEHLS